MTPREKQYWKTRIAAALKLWRSSVRGFQAAALDHMRECQLKVPAMYKAMSSLATDQLDEYKP